MSDVNTVEAAPTEEAAPRVGGTITIEVSESNIQYNSAMSLPEVVFWLDTVKQMIIAKVLGGGNE